MALPLLRQARRRFPSLSLDVSLFRFQSCGNKNRMNAFQQLLDSVRPIHGETSFSAEIGESWLQGRTAFGGLTSALVVQAMQQVVPGDRRLRSLYVSFVGPAPVGRHRIQLRPLREGGSVTHIQGDMICDGDIAASITATFGRDRPSQVKVDGPPMPDVAPADNFESIPFIEGLTPVFTRHYEMRFAYGHPPLSGADTADFGMWLRFRESREADLAALIAIADVPPMPGFNMIEPPGVGSSLTWYLEFPTALPSADAGDWWYYDYRCQAGGNGYFHNYATVWSPTGEAVMFSRQVAAIFEKK